MLELCSVTSVLRSTGTRGPRGPQDLVDPQGGRGEGNQRVITLQKPLVSPSRYEPQGLDSGGPQLQTQETTNKS